MEKQDSLARHGITLSKNVLRRLNAVGIVAQSQVTLEHQHLAKRYVVRGIESGGAVKEMGRYVSYADPKGEPLEFLHPLDAIGVNGVHAVVVAPVLVRVEMFRIGRTCQLLITQHQPSEAEHGRRPALANQVLFRGVNGLINMSASSKATEGLGAPQFWSRAGETVDIPAIFAAVVAATAMGVCCVGCSHSHFLRAPVLTLSSDLGSPSERGQAKEEDHSPVR
jgi:hypothetical protein